MSDLLKVTVIVYMKTVNGCINLFVKTTQPFCVSGRDYKWEDET